MLSFDALERAFESARVQSNKYNGRTANEKGQRAEVRCLNAVKEVIADCPWAYSARLASQKEDSSGIDIVIDSVLGKLYLQVKSSRYGAFRYRRKRRRAEALIIIVFENMHDEKLKRKVHNALYVLRRRVLQLRHN